MIVHDGMVCKGCELRRYGECSRYCDVYSCGDKYCDRCGKETDWLYVLIWDEVCRDCFLQGCEYDEDTDSYYIEEEWVPDEEIDFIYKKI